MKNVFADACYWIATVNPGDSLSVMAQNAHQKLGPVLLVTTDEALTEFLTSLSNQGPHLREKAVKMVRQIMRHSNIRVIAQSRGSFLAGVHLYSQRNDKAYSLPDCVAMNTIRAEGIQEVLTNDHHFEQEGFTILMKP